MAANVDNIGVPTVCNRAFVALALDAGIEELIVNMIPFAVDKRSLLISLKEALIATDAELAAALNTDNLDEILDFITRKGKSPIKFAEDLPYQLNEIGPLDLSASRDGTTPTTINITIQIELPQEHTKYAIYLDNIFQKLGNETPVGDEIDETLEDVPDDGLQHSIGVLYVEPQYEVSPDVFIEAITYFGPFATFT